ncbi:MAG: hypothetical protein EB120_03235 [Proteobacteria bacterium]|nr:hypothetical protein [Pseudomonadota bacterium]NDG26173.1 hypothetical protein [Pseudomonadota bacterium]
MKTQATNNNPLLKGWALGLLLSLCAPLSPITTANEWSWETGGSLKSFIVFQKLRQTRIYANNEEPFNEERLRLQGSLTYRWARLEIANETFFHYRRNNPSLIPVPDFSPQSAWRPQWTLFDSTNADALNRFDRAFMQLEFGDFKTTFGKQVVPMGVGQIFNAVSQIQRYPLIFIDPEFPKTEDAATFIWSGPFQVEARYLPKSPGQQTDNFHFRMKKTISGIDIALTGGRSDNKTFFGGESAFNVGQGLLRVELVSYFSNQKHYGQGLLGFDYVFSPAWSSKWEVFYNSFGEVTQNPLTGLFHRSAPFQGTWYAGNVTTWEIHPLLKANLVSIVNLKDPSALFHFFLNYSISNSWDLLAGQFLNVGSGTSEFGGQFRLTPVMSLGQPDISYAALRWYF